MKVMTPVAKTAEAFRTISEVAEELDVPQHVLRFWETRFTHVRPMKRGGGRRYYRPEDVTLLKGIRKLLYGEGFTIKGVKKILKEKGASHVSSLGGGGQARAVTMVDGGNIGAPVSRALPSERLSAAAGAPRGAAENGAGGLASREIELLKRAKSELSDLRDMLTYARESV